MAALGQQAAAALLDFNQKLDINLLDSVVVSMYSGNGDTQRIAQEVLTTLKEHPDAWTRVDTILEYSTNQQTKYYALQILEQVIKTRWKVLPRNQCEGIKKYIVSLIIKTSSDAETLEANKTYLNKLNMILVQVLKREWPKNWESFIPDIVGASKTNESLCQNNMIILKLLSEELFDFSSGQITQTKAKHLKDTMCTEFSAIFHLCQFVLENSQNPPLVNATLETLLRFLNWIPLGYIFETNLINTFIFKFLPVPMFRNVTLKCLTEIAGVTVRNYDDMFVLLFTQTMTQLEIMLPLQTDIKSAYACGQDQEQNFIQNLALFLCTFLKEHSNIAENQFSTMVKGLRYLVLISEVEDVEIFKICLEYWNTLASELYQEVPHGGARSVFFGRLGVSKEAFVNMYQDLYREVLNKVRYIMISRMAKPEEVLVVENDNGEVVREFMKDTDSINLYKNMRETLVYLTHLDCADTERIMTNKLQNQVNGTEWSWKNLNTLCWAIGSISGAMHEEDEKRFLVTVIKDLLGLCEQKRGKDNKAIIASNIMYVVGQYPRFLRAHWKFLKTVVNKLFEFMHETHDGVQDMACDTFIKIALKCRRHFVTTQIGESCPFIEEILASISTIICDLQQQQVHTFYEAVGYMISAQVDAATQEALIEKYMMLPNQVWDDIISQASKNVDFLKEIEIVKQLASILKTNVRACKALNHAYVLQLGRIYLDMLNVYKVMSENITAAIQLNGEVVTKQPLIKAMRVVKKETLKLISDWISRSSDNGMVLDNFIPPFLDAVLLDYQRTQVAAAREPEVLSAIATIVNRLESHITLEKIHTLSKQERLRSPMSPFWNMRGEKNEKLNCRVFGDLQKTDYWDSNANATISKLISDWISHWNDNGMVLDNFIPPFLDAVLLDYQRTQVAAAREPEVLSAIAMIVNRLESYITLEVPKIFDAVFKCTLEMIKEDFEEYPEHRTNFFLLLQAVNNHCFAAFLNIPRWILCVIVPKIFDAVFECTLEMINKDFEEYPEHRTNFFLLLQAVNNHCFAAFLNIPPTQFKLVLDSIIWAFKHTMRNVADTGLQILLKLLQNVEQHEAAAPSFYQTYLTDILQHVFSVVTDTSHTSGLSMHATILAYIFSLVEAGRVNCQIGPGADNVQYIQEFTATLLKSAFPHLTDNQIKIMVQGMFNLDQDIPAFKEHLRDFLVQIREYTGEDDTDLFLEEREKSLQAAQSEKRRIQLSVPGILNPHEVPEEMQD